MPSGNGTAKTIFRRELRRTGTPFASTLITPNHELRTVMSGPSVPGILNVLSKPSSLCLSSFWCDLDAFDGSFDGVLYDRRRIS